MYRVLPRVIVAMALASVAVACGSEPTADTSTPATPQLQAVDEALAGKAQSSCWFKVKNRSGRGEEVRLWSAVSSTGATTTRLGELLIVSGAMEPAVRDARFYGCSLFEYTPGSPVVMTATDSPVPLRADNLIPYGFSRDGRKELK